ncbi:MAG: radical SAM protein [Fusobacteriaceae bacterium]
MSLKDNFTLIVKTTTLCNLRCSYCFDNVDKTDKTTIDIGVIKHMLELVTSNYTNVTLILHGGEVLLNGVDFFKDVHEIVVGFREKGFTIKMCLQTNMILYEEYKSILSDLDINIGASCDFINNNKNRMSDEESSKLISNIMSDNIGSVCVVDYESSYLLIDFYDTMRFFENYPKLNKLSNIQDRKLWDQYINNWKIYYHHVLMTSDSLDDIIDPSLQSIVNLINGKHYAVSCNHLFRHDNFLGVDVSGHITLCDRVFPDKYKFGNVFDYNKLEDVFLSSTYSSFVAEYQTQRKYCFEKCNVYKLCNGGCTANQIQNGILVFDGESLECKFNIEIYKYIESIINNYRGH